MPNDTTTAVQHPPKAHLGLQTTRWLRPSSFNKHSCLHVGQCSSRTHPGLFHYNLRSTPFTDREQRLLCIRVITNASSKPSAPSVTPPIAHVSSPNPDHTWNAYFRTAVTRKTEASIPGMFCPHSLGNEPPAVAASAGATSAQKFQVRKTTRNPKFR